jgi:hypothetical protein
MKKLILFFIFLFFNSFLVNAISIYPTEINNSINEIYITNYFDKEINLVINSKNLKFDDLINVNETKIIFVDSFKKTNEDFLEINIYYNNLNLVFEIPIEFEKNKKKIPIFTISSIILGICVVVIIKFV